MPRDALYNWTTPQTVTVTGVDDAIDDGDIAYTIILTTTTSGDGNYNGLDPADVNLSNIDDDGVGFTVSQISRPTTEAGGTATFTVKLNSQPAANVTIALSSNDTTEGTVSPASLTFTPASWNTPRTVTVKGVDDAVADGNITYKIITGAASSTDATYNGLAVADVTVVNNDNDQANASRRFIFLPIVRR